MQNHIQRVRKSLWQQLSFLTLPVCSLVLPLWFLRAASLTTTRELIGFGKLRPSESLDKIDVQDSRLEILATQPRCKVGSIKRAHLVQQTTPLACQSSNTGSNTWPLLHHSSPSSFSSSSFPPPPLPPPGPPAPHAAMRGSLLCRQKCRETQIFLFLVPFIHLLMSAGAVPASSVLSARDLQHLLTACAATLPITCYCL